jgi:hypothetical protein
MLRGIFITRWGKSALGRIPRLHSQIGAPDRNRTCDHLLRRQMLYPTELRAQPCTLIRTKSGIGQAHFPKHVGYGGAVGIHVLLIGPRLEASEFCIKCIEAT